MTSTTKDLFYGWDLLYKTIEEVITKKDDLLIALAHFILTKSQFKCISVGDDKTLSEDEEHTGSELLPNNWNDDDNTYSLRYVNNSQLYILLGLRTEGSLIITLLDVKTHNVSNIGLDSEELVKSAKGNLKTIIPTASQIVDRFEKELLEPVFPGTRKSATTQTAATSTSIYRPGADGLAIGEPRVPFALYTPTMPPPPFLYPVGRGDLDPLGRGGGNLFPFHISPDYHFDPDHRRGIGLVRPRFDLLNPPDPNIRPNPNPDHYQPPGFGGDYY